ncbi:flavin reductase [Prauserella sp. PE36]|uniref:flavin reductase family protein n=1 Tax=Prauserella sp. PE36 TaxID=1504709 RepID=UPI000DE20C32|nr:flavin reductase family protein [Prauserella sp. PE36]RBM21523.1 flavin reductase [Prauserella sp. PE36]
METVSSPSLTDDFREVMSGVCTPVAVVTTMDGDRPHGTTVSAFASLSLEPPMVLAALDRRSELLALVRARGRFGLNVLASGQQALATRFARKGADKFQGVPWRTEHGLPRLPGVAGWLACRVHQLVSGGDHVIALGLVDAAQRLAVSPLTYHARGFGTHLPVTGERC